MIHDQSCYQLFMSAFCYRAGTAHGVVALLTLPALIIHRTPIHMRDHDQILRAAAIAGLLAAGTANATNGYFSEGYGVVAEGVAGATTALSLDSLTIASNPAGLAGLGTRVDLGLDVFAPRRGATITQGGGSASFDGNDTATFYIPSLGYSHALAQHWAWGIALYGNGGLNTDYANNPFAGLGAQGAAGVNLSQAFLSPAIAWQYADGQSIGLAANLVYQEFEAKGVGLFSGFSSSPGSVSNRGKDTSTGIGARLGWRARLAPGLTVGASWQPKISTGKFKKYAGLFADQGGFDVPQTYALGVAWQVVDAVTLSLDGQRIDYSGVHSVGNSVASLFSGVPLGATNGPGFGWQDVTVVKAGLQYRASAALTLRAGYSHATQPVPDDQTFFNILAPGVVQTHATIGAGFALGEHASLDLSWQHAFEQTVHGHNSIPQSFGGGEVDVRLKEDVFGIGYSYRL
jgi:long-chain fatty acid transport protein